MRPLTAAATACLAMAALLIAVLPARAASPVVVVEPVRVLNGHTAEARYYYTNNWQVLRDMALARGFIHSYEIIYADEASDEAFDLLLITRYSDPSQLAKAEERFQALIREHGSLRLLNDLAPADFRKGLGAYTGTSESVAPAQ